MLDRASSPLTRPALFADAVVSGVTGLLLTLGAPVASPILGLDAGLLVGAGLFCVGYGAIIGWLARRPAVSDAAVTTVVGGNAAGVVGSVIFLFLGPSTMTTLGSAFVGFQAAVVAGLAEWQWLGLRRQRRAPAPASQSAAAGASHRV